MSDDPKKPEAPKDRKKPERVKALYFVGKWHDKQKGLVEVLGTAESNVDAETKIASGMVAPNGEFFAVAIRPAILVETKQKPIVTAKRVQ